MWAQTLCCHKATWIPTQCDWRETLQNRDFSRVPLTKPSMAGHRLLQFASVDYFVWNPRWSFWGYNSPCVSKKMEWTQGAVQITEQHCHPELLLQSCTAARQQVQLPKDLCVAWVRQQLPQPWRKLSNCFWLQPDVFPKWNRCISFLKPSNMLTRQGIHGCAVLIKATQVSAVTPVHQPRFPVTEPLLSLPAFITGRNVAARKNHMEGLKDRDFAWHHDIKSHTWPLICKLWQCFNPDCRISLSPHSEIPLLPGPPFKHPSLLTTCPLQPSNGWGVLLLPGDLATSQGLFCFLTGAEPPWRKKCALCTSMSVTHSSSLRCSWRSLSATLCATLGTLTL